jgi:hypothetical protein
MVKAVVLYGPPEALCPNGTRSGTAATNGPRRWLAPPCESGCQNSGHCPTLRVAEPVGQTPELPARLC